MESTGKFSKQNLTNKSITESFGVNEPFGDTRGGGKIEIFKDTVNTRSENRRY